MTFHTLEEQRAAAATLSELLETPAPLLIYAVTLSQHALQCSATALQTNNLWKTKVAQINTKAVAAASEQLAVTDRQWVGHAACAVASTTAAWGQRT